MIMKADRKERKEDLLGRAMTTRKMQERILMIEDLAVNNSKAFRALWLLVQYQHYRLEETFDDVIPMVTQTIHRIHRDERTGFSDVTRSQALGRLREDKQRNFIEEYDGYVESMGLSYNGGAVREITHFAVAAPIELLLYHDNGGRFVLLSDSSITVSREEWEGWKTNDVSCFTLPQMLSGDFNHWWNIIHPDGNNGEIPFK